MGNLSNSSLLSCKEILVYLIRKHLLSKDLACLEAGVVGDSKIKNTSCLPSTSRNQDFYTRITQVQGILREML